jgi:Icc protein
MRDIGNDKAAPARIDLDDSDVLSFVHFGDLHITNEREQNYHDFLSLIADVNRNLGRNVSFAVLPGDNTEDGTEDQYRLVRAAIDQLAISLCAIPGDHDIKTGNLDMFRQYLEAEPVRTVVAGPYHCIFLNSVDSGVKRRFGLGPSQLGWLRRELQTASRLGRHSVLFMHTYPSELGDSAQEVQTLLHQHRVLMVDMGHTHYNEIANDGRTMYAATRSTGQIEEGPVGFSIANLDGGVVSWKFKPLDAPWPVVMITTPADRAFIIDPTEPEQLVRGVVEVRAKAWHDRSVVSANCRIDDGPWRAMSRIGASPTWACAWESFTATNGVHHITVQVQGTDGREATDTISALTNQSGRYEAPPRRPGDDSNAISAYPEKGILGTQLGPNKNGRKW